MFRKLVIATFALGLAAAGAACDSGGDTPEASADAGNCPGATFPVTIEAANGSITLDECPERIVSLSPTATEILYAIGAGDRVVAVDDQSDYPDGVPTTELSGYEPNVEAIAGYEPDLVVVQAAPDDLEAGLDKLGVVTLVQPAALDFDDMYDQIEQLGAATGHDQEAGELGEQIEADLAELAASVPERDEPLTYYHELDDTYYTATSATFIGKVYGLAGLENIADAVDDGSGFPQLSAEHIVDSDPDVIFLADSECCGITAETVTARPGWDAISAVQTGTIVELDEDVSSRWGPRVVEFFATVIDAVRAATDGSEADADADADGDADTGAAAAAAAA